MMFDTIHHIAIIGSDYEKSKHFYVDLLGFQIIRENYRAERDDYKIDLACGQQEIELFIIKNAPARVNYPEALGLRHLAFKVKSVDDTVKELNEKGIEMIYKVFYQETKERNPRRENTHSLYLDIDAKDELEGRIKARKLVEEKTPYNVELITLLSDKHLEYEKESGNFTITEL